MAVVSIPTLKSYFETGDFPTESQFIDLIDTLNPAMAVPAWGSITGTLSNQTDLQTALNTKFQQGGNSFGTTARLGTNDLFSLEIETNNVLRATIGTDIGGGIFGINDIPLADTLFYIKGTGATSATNHFITKNSAGAISLKLSDDPDVGGALSNYVWQIDRSGLTDSYLLNLNRTEGTNANNVNNGHLIISSNVADSGGFGSHISLKNIHTNGGSFLSISGKNGARAAQLCSGNLFGQDLQINLLNNLGFAIGDNNGFKKFQLDVNYNILLGTSATVPASMVGGMAMLNGTAPSGNVTDQFSFYAADQAAGNSAPHFRTENGNIVKLFRGATIADASGGAIIDAEARTALNALLARMRVTGGNGLIAD